MKEGEQQKTGRPKEAEVIKAELGDHVENFIQQLMELSEQEHRDVTGKFNEVEIFVPVGSDPNDMRLAQNLERKYSKDIATKGHEAFEREMANPESRTAKYYKKMEEDKKEGLEKIRNFDAWLKSLDFGDLGAVLKWLCDLEKLTSRGDILELLRKGGHIQATIKAFEEAGFRAHEFVDKITENSDAQTKARYIIGQALAGLKENGYISQTIHGFTERWKAKHYHDKKQE